MYDEPQYQSRRNKYHKRIVEVYWDDALEVQVRVPAGLDENNKMVYTIEKRKGGWRSKRIREDKSLPNDQSVYASVLRAQH